ncbi:MAG: hypothetical protein DRH04_07400 [Deltaproteobacteria bacterium]|nr:MAG: hypothetical protein DRH04_07400 [Deltaproteobacteria bacterium]
MYPKWDDFSFAGVTTRHWRFRIKTTDDPDHLIIRELEFYGRDCLGELACPTSSCGAGLCKAVHRPGKCVLHVRRLPVTRLLHQRVHRRGSRLHHPDAVGQRTSVDAEVP